MAALSIPALCRPSGAARPISWLGRCNWQVRTCSLPAFGEGKVPCNWNWSGFSMPRALRAARPMPAKVACLRRGMLPPDLFQDRKSAATPQAMTNRHRARYCAGLSEITVRDLPKRVSGTCRNCCPGLRETRSSAPQEIWPWKPSDAFHGQKEFATEREHGTEKIRPQSLTALMVSQDLAANETKARA